MSRAWQWYGVKSIYRETPKGRPKGKDDRYVAGLTLVEERVVLIRARSFDEAIRKGEQEANRYIEHTKSRNRYGQELVGRLINCEAYDMSPDDPVAGVEVFSSMELVPKSLSDDELLGRVIGCQADADRSQLTDNFGNIVFTGAASGVRLNKDERDFVARCKALPEKPRRDA